MRPVPTCSCLPTSAVLIVIECPWKLESSDPSPPSIRFPTHARHICLAWNRGKTRARQGKAKVCHFTDSPPPSLDLTVPVSSELRETCYRYIPAITAELKKTRRDKTRQRTDAFRVDFDSFDSCPIYIQYPYRFNIVIFCLLYINLVHFILLLSACLLACLIAHIAIPAIAC